MISKALVMFRFKEWIINISRALNGIFHVAIGQTVFQNRADALCSLSGGKSTSAFRIAA